MRNATGLFTKDRFSVDLATQSVTCPAGQRVAINSTCDGGGRASFKIHCPLRTACTKSRSGRTIAIGRHEGLLQEARAEQATPEWQARYRADRPKVERKISHFTRRAWGGRNAGCEESDASAPTLTPAPERSIWLDWPSWVSATTAIDGAWPLYRAPEGSPCADKREFTGYLRCRVHRPRCMLIFEPSPRITHVGFPAPARGR